jgi:hypothetical protein
VCECVGTARIAGLVRVGMWEEFSDCVDVALIPDMGCIQFRSSDGFRRGINSGTEQKADRARGLDRFAVTVRRIGSNAAHVAMGGSVVSVFEPPFRVGGPRSATV